MKQILKAFMDGVSQGIVIAGLAVAGLASWIAMAAFLIGSWDKVKDCWE